MNKLSPRVTSQQRGLDSCMHLFIKNHKNHYSDLFTNLHQIIQSRECFLPWCTWQHWKKTKINEVKKVSFTHSSPSTGPTCWCSFQKLFSYYLDRTMLYTTTETQHDDWSLKRMCRRVEARRMTAECRAQRARTQFCKRSASSASASSSIMIKPRLQIKLWMNFTSFFK